MKTSFAPQAPKTAGLPLPCHSRRVCCIFSPPIHSSAPSNVASTPTTPQMVNPPPWFPGPDSPKVIVVPGRVTQGTFLSSRLISQSS